MRRFIRPWFAALVVALAYAVASNAAVRNEATEWSQPRGAHRVTVEPYTLVDNYADIPAGLRRVLAYKMLHRLYDDVADIKRDTIVGGKSDYTNLRDMHFGDGHRVAIITRRKWDDHDAERGLVYCAKDSKVEHCVIVPFVCGNLSRLDRVNRRPSEATTPPAEPPITPGAPPAERPGNDHAGGYTIPSINPGPFVIDYTFAGGLRIPGVDPVVPGQQDKPETFSGDPEWTPWPWGLDGGYRPILWPINNLVVLPPALPPIYGRCPHSRSPRLRSAGADECAPIDLPSGGGGSAPVAPVPELSTAHYAMLGLAAVLLAVRRRSAIEKTTQNS